MNTAVQVQARVRSTAGKISKFKMLGTWSSRDDRFRRTSAGTQRDAVAWVNTDTLHGGLRRRAQRLPAPRAAAAHSGSTATPTVRSVHAVASRPATAAQATSKPLYGGKTLAVPRYSQMIHRGQYPQYGGGGEAWCSPTSLSMILGYYKALPSKANYAWVNKSYADPWVDHVARPVFDYGYDGAGNWPFNTAYAASLTTNAFVTRLSSLREAERFIHAGIPLAASISFGKGGLNGAPISSTAGHLVVISGFTRAGKVVVNDPAAPNNSSVRRVYDRGQFERAWQTKSHGTVYVVRDAAHPLPARAGNGWWASVSPVAGDSPSRRARRKCRSREPVKPAPSGPVPPSTSSFCPLTNPAREDARKQTASAMSWAIPNRRSGMLLRVTRAPGRRARRSRSAAGPSRR